MLKTYCFSRERQLRDHEEKQARAIAQKDQERQLKIRELHEREASRQRAVMARRRQADVSCFCVKFSFNFFCVKSFR